MDELTPFLKLVEQYGLWPIVALAAIWKLSPVFAEGFRTIAGAMAAGEVRVADALNTLSTRVIDRIDRQSDAISANTAAIAANTTSIQGLSVQLRNANGNGPKT